MVETRGGGIENLDKQQDRNYVAYEQQGCAKLKIGEISVSAGLHTTAKADSIND